MPIHEYQCPTGHTTEKFFKTFGDAENTDPIPCTVCGESAERALSTPLPAHFYGSPSGYYKPSATQRGSYKTISTKYGNGTKN